MRFGVLSCTCKEIWAVELRHAAVRCPQCRKSLDTTTRKPLWVGATAMEAAEAAGQFRAQAAGVPIPVRAIATPRHDSPAQAAAAQAIAVTNKSARAELVALWMTRLVGQPTHDDLREALEHAGLDRARAEREIMRMLAMDYLMEPRAGSYRVLET